MAKKALILDLDNTIYPVSSIGEKLFKRLFELIHESGEYSGDFEDIKVEIMRTPFQKVAKAFSFSETLYSQSMDLLKDLTYKDPMIPFEDYQELRKIKITRFLVTVGFLNMQQSKVRQLGIEKDFDSIYIIDPEISKLTKKDVFLEIMKNRSFVASDLLVIGDDPESEIKAAKELGIDALVYDPDSKYDLRHDLIKVLTFSEVQKYI